MKTYYTKKEFGLDKILEWDHDGDTVIEYQRIGEESPEIKKKGEKRGRPAKVSSDDEPSYGDDEILVRKKQLSEEEKDDIREAIRNGDPVHEIADKFGVKKIVIVAIKRHMGDY